LADSSGVSSARSFEVIASASPDLLELAAFDLGVRELERLLEV